MTISLSTVVRAYHGLSGRKAAPRVIISGWRIVIGLSSGMIARVDYSSAQTVADRAQQIYQERFQTAFEQTYSGRYVIIDILTKKAYVAVSVEENINKAKAEAPDGLFHLIRIGSAALRTSTINSYS